MSPPSSGRLGRFVNTLEESLIAFTLALMTLLTFANVIARYVFQSNILWSQEMVGFLFAWLILLGISYCFKSGAHLGVDALVGVLPGGLQRFFGLLAVAACLAYGGMLLYGAWSFWQPFVGQRAWYEVNDIPMPEAFQFIADWFNDGEKYEKIPRFIPYVMLPIGFLLFFIRAFQAGLQVLRGERRMVIASHEAEEDVAAVAAMPEPENHAAPPMREGER